MPLRDIGSFINSHNDGFVDVGGGVGDNHLPDNPFLDQVRAGNNVLADSRAIYDDIDTRFHPRRLGYLRLVERRDFAIIYPDELITRFDPPFVFSQRRIVFEQIGQVAYIGVDIINRDQIKIATQLIYACHVSSDAPKSVNTQAIFHSTCPSALYCRPGLPSVVNCVASRPCSRIPLTIEQNRSSGSRSRS